MSSAPKAGEIKDGEGGMTQQRQQRKRREQAGEATAELSGGSLKQCSRR